MVASAAQPGTLTGRILNKEGRPLYDVFVSIESGTGLKGKKFTPPKSHPVMDQRDYRYIPHVMGVLVGTTVDFKNSDYEMHSVYSPSPIKTFDLGNQPMGLMGSVAFDKPGLVEVRCYLHHEMRAWIHVKTNPYFAVADMQGRYRIPDVPPGSYRLKIWHERAGERIEEVKAGQGNTVLDLRY